MKRDPDENARVNPEPPLAGEGEKETKPTTFSLAVNSIIDYIQRNHLKAGATLPPAEVFCDKYNFSRVIFREAMSYLKGLGIIEAGRGRGIRLCNPDPLGRFGDQLPIFFSVMSNFNELYLLRCDLEIGALSRIIEQITPEELDDLEKLLQKGDEIMNRESGFEVIEVNDIDRRFHQILARASGNRLLEMVSNYYRILFNSLDMYNAGKLEDTFLFSQLRESQKQHHAILECLRMGCLEACTQLMIKHLHKKVDFEEEAWFRHETHTS